MKILMSATFSAFVTLLLSCCANPPAPANSCSAPQTNRSEHSPTATLHVRFQAQSITIEQLPPDGFDFLRNVSHVTSFGVGMSSRIPSDKPHIPTLPSLRVLRLSQCSGATIETFRSIAKLPSLEVLDPPLPKDDEMAEACMKELANCPKLRELSRTVGKSDAALNVLPRIHTLEVVAVGADTFAAFQNLSQCRRLRKLTVGVHERFTLDYVRILAQMPALSELTISNSEAYAKGTLSALSACKHLSALSVHIVGETPESDWEELATIQTLVSLDVDTDVTPEKLRHLSKLRHLRSLTLRFADWFNDEWVDVVRQLPLEDLHFLCNRDTNTVSAGAMRRLLEMPSLRSLEIYDWHGRMQLPAELQYCNLRRLRMHERYAAWLNLLCQVTTGLIVEIPGFSAENLKLADLTRDTRLKSIELTGGYSATDEYLEKWRALWPNVRIEPVGAS